MAASNELQVEQTVNSVIDTIIAAVARGEERRARIGRSQTGCGTGGDLSVGVALVCPRLDSPTLLPSLHPPAQARRSRSRALAASTRGGWPRGQAATPLLASQCSCLRASLPPSPWVSACAGGAQRCRCKVCKSRKKSVNITRSQNCWFQRWTPSLARQHVRPVLCLHPPTLPLTLAAGKTFKDRVKEGHGLK